MRATTFACLLLASIGFACSEPRRSDIAEVLDALPEPVSEMTIADTSPSTPTPTTSPSERRCETGGLATRSLRPDEDLPHGGALAEIRARGRLVVGVDENTLGFSSRSTTTGDIEGFEVDLATEIAARIFDDDGANHVDLKPVVTSEKLSFVENGQVDMTISANSMKCDRWERVAFSSEYYTAHQQFLVRRDSTIETRADLDGATVCVTSDSSSKDLLAKLVPEAEIHLESDRTGCLAALQEGEVDAYFGHNSFLYGMTYEDPTVISLDLLPKVHTVSHYGVAISRDHPELVRFVNAVLEDVRTDGTWQELHMKWLQPIGVPADNPPAARYRD